VHLPIRVFISFSGYINQSFANTFHVKNFIPLPSEFWIFVLRFVYFLILVVLGRLFFFFFF
jgi:hypothetical protein